MKSPLPNPHYAYPAENRRVASDVSRCGLTRARDREAEIEGRTRIDVSPHFLDPIQMRTGGDEKEMPQA